MQTHSSDSIAQIEGFLRTDPQNDTLRTEAFEACLRHGELDRAEIHLRWGLDQGEERLGWRFRQAHWLLAARRWPDAEALLDALRRDPQSPPALRSAATVDLAQACLHTGAAARGIELMRQLMPPAAAAPHPTAVQVLWLRLLHRDGKLAEALQWARTEWRERRLAPAAAGVASLAALDAGDLQACRQWAECALQEPGTHMEAWVARASLALAEQDQPTARQWLSRALAHNSNDGRARSALAYVHLQASELEAARREFELAVTQLAEHIGTWHGLGWTCLLQADLPAASNAFETSLHLDRNFAESHGGLAAVQVRQSQTAAATASIERALRLDRHCLSAHYAKALLEGKADDGVALQELAHRLIGDKTRALRSRGSEGQPEG